MSKEVPIEYVQMTQGTEKIEERKPIWSKNQRRFFDIMAVLSFINILAYFVTQSSYVIQNWTYLYGFVTFIDVAGFVFGLAYLNEYNKQHFKKRFRELPIRFKTYIFTTGLWMLTIPFALLAYFGFPYPLSFVLFNLWGASLTASGVYGVSYIICVVGQWLTHGMPVENWK